MTVAEFLAWKGDGTGRRYELVEGVLRAQDSASDTHGTIQASITRVIGNHLLATQPNCRVVAAPGIQPNLRANWNHRVPEIAVTCTPTRPGVHKTPNPILIIRTVCVRRCTCNGRDIASQLSARAWPSVVWVRSMFSVVLSAYVECQITSGPKL